ELDKQAQNHRVTPVEVQAYVAARLELLKNARSNRGFEPPQEGLGRAPGSACCGELKRELGVIDFGDQIDRAIEIAERYPQIVLDHRARFAAVLLDEYQDTNVAQADLMHALFGG